MSLPPLNLLLPHLFTFKDYFSDYPFLITSPSPTALVIFLLTYHASENPVQHSILICCGEVQECLQHMPGAFLKNDAVRKGKFLQSVSRINIMRVKTLHELRAVLYLLSVNSATPEHRSQSSKTSHATIETGEAHDAEASSIADSEESDEEVQEHSGPILGISGMDRLHRDAGELSVQGLARTIASALEASGSSYKLILHGNEDIEDELALMNDSSYLPAQLAGATTTFRKFYSKYIGCEWNATAHAVNGSTEATWRYLNGGGYRVVWEENEDGECINSTIARLQENTTLST